MPGIAVAAILVANCLFDIAGGECGWDALATPLLLLAAMLMMRRSAAMRIAQNNSENSSNTDNR